MTDSSIDSVLGAIARDAMPAIEAVRAQPQLVSPTGIGISSLWIVISQAILRSPAFPGAEQVIRSDPVLGPAVAGGRGYTETAFGSGGPFQAETLALNLVHAACIELLVCGKGLTPDALAQAAVQNVNKLREALQGDEVGMWCVIAFGGIAPQVGDPIHTPWGDLVAADRLTSEIWNDEPGRCTAVLATPVRTKLVSQEHNEVLVSAFPAQVYRIGQLTSFGIALGSNRQDPATAVPLHTGGLPPWGMHGWGGEVRMPGFTNRSAPLSAEEGEESAAWMRDLDGVQIGRIDVGLRRLVRGLAERLDAADQLIDAVIAWENLVEHRDQPTGSVIWGMTHLAQSSGWSKTRINNVYKIRSDVVHGEDPDYARVLSYAPEALQIGLDALRYLLRHHRDTLEMTSEQRSIALGYQISPST